ncbi:hypothetical protein BHU61_00485 [Macrococcus epidermidis]|uniref:Uncharacterized protein n=1 Tax=Macrococcus epidermidis TaxID=1902580 RepID=A0A327ZV66_9STAP|nr:hypothetical protein [Macrococcus epidermidis]RAK45956.1 hypothetical protein BHU61_00485 [Macrococcus epidermidis]
MDTVILREEDKATLRKYNIDPEKFEEDFEDIFRMIGYEYDELLFSEFGYEFDPDEIEQIPRIAAMKKDFLQIYDHIAKDEGYLNYNHHYVSSYSDVSCEIKLKDGTIIKGKSTDTHWENKEINIEVKHLFSKQIVKINLDEIEYINIKNSTI